MRLSKAYPGVSEVLNLLYFVWFPAHRLRLSSETRILRLDASRGVKMGSLGGYLVPKGPHPEALKLVWGGETSRHQGQFRTVFYTSKPVLCWSVAEFRDDVRCYLYHADVHFILYFTHQDGPPMRCCCRCFRLRRGSLSFRMFRIGQDWL